MTILTDTIDTLDVLGIAYPFTLEEEVSVHYQAMQAIQATIRDLDLTGIDDDSIIIRKLPIDRRIGRVSLGEIEFPAIIISPGRVSIAAKATNERDDYTYRIIIALLETDNQEPTFVANLSRHTMWRQRIDRRLNNRRLEGVAAENVSFVSCKCEPGDAVLPEAWLQNYQASAILASVTFREPRDNS